MRALDKKTVLVLGTGRSGTTWLAGLLASPFRYRLLFEPFHPEHVEGAESVADRYYPPDSIPAAVESLCRAALNDRINSDWIAQGSSRRLGMHRWRFWPRVRIVKSIRTNLLVPVYREIFGEELPIVVIVRRPEEVVESFLRVGFSWGPEVDTLLEQSPVLERWELPRGELHALSGSPAGALATRWLLENIEWIRGSGRSGVHVVRYERLLEDPVGVVRSLCETLGIEAVDDLEQRAGRRSHTTHPRSPAFSATSPELGEAHRRIIREVLEIGGLVADERVAGGPGAADPPQPAR